MKHVNIVQGNYSEGLKEKVDSWLVEHKDEILKVIDIEYNKYGNIYTATITYEEIK